jgi:hypothetical protein
MDKVKPQHNFQAILIASPAHTCSWELTFMLDRLGLSYISCDNIYQAAGNIVTSKDDDQLIVIGTFTQLCKSNMKLVTLCQDRENTHCCCLVDGIAGPELIQAVKANALAAYDIITLENIVKDILVKPIANPNRAILKEEKLLSQDELDALLGA